MDVRLDAGTAVRRLHGRRPNDRCAHAGQSSSLCPPVEGGWFVGRGRASAEQSLVGPLGARAWHGLLAEEREAVDELREPRAGKADDGLGGLQVGRLAAAVAAHGEVQALLDVGDDSGVHAGRLQYGRAAQQTLAATQVHLGERLLGSTAVLQATCVDATIIPYIEQRLNFTMGCYGCREATDLQPAETVVGFPGERLGQLVDSLDFLAEKAVPRSRAKRAHEALVTGRAGATDEPSPFERKDEQ